MDITPLVRPDLNLIQSYKDGLYKITGRVFKGAIIVTADDVYAYDRAGEEVTTINPSTFAFLSGKIETILIGKSEGAMPLPVEVRTKYKEYGFSVDVMDIGSACRTYNVLMTEGRSAAVLLL